MIGGFQTSHIEAHHQNFVNHHLAQINAKVGGHATSYTVHAVSTQVVAGTNYYIHITSNDGHHYSVLIYEPLPHTGQPTQLLFAEAGHTQAHHAHN